MTHLQSLLEFILQGFFGLFPTSNILHITSYFSIIVPVKFFRSLSIALVALLFASVSLQAAPYDPPTWRDSTWDYRSEDPGDTTELSIAKGVGVASTVLIAYGAAYWLVFQKGWWDEQGSDFHFENDFDYALNLDKFGHFASGVMMGETFYEGYRWAGISEFNSYLFAGLSAFATRLFAGMGFQRVRRAERDPGRLLPDGGALRSRVQVRRSQVELLDQFQGVLQTK